MSHEPKIAALLAYDAELLSDDGRRRVERHLGACEVCLEALASMRAYDALLQDVKRAPIPTPDYPRMELPLRRAAHEAAREVSDRKAVAPMVFLAFAAAALFFVWVAGHTGEDSSFATRGVQTAAPAQPEAPRAAVNGELTLVAGQVHLDGEVETAPGGAVAENSVLIADESSEAHVRFAEGTGMALEAHTEVRVAELREGRVTLDLAHGTVANQVAHLALGDRYEVHAGPYVFRVRGTRFAVSRKAEDVALVVAEGVVEVSRGERIEAVVQAPGAWRSGFVVWGPQSVRRPVGLTGEAADWPVLRVRVGQGAHRIRVGSRDIEASGVLAMRVPRGEVEVGIGALEGRLETQLVEVGETGEVVEGAALVPDAPPEREGYLPPALLAPPVRAGMRNLQACHQQEARRGEPPSGVFSLRVTIGLTGRVERAQLIQRRGSAPSQRFRQCVTQEAQRWSFPPPTGGRVTFDQPLRFTTRMP